MSEHFSEPGGHQVVEDGVDGRAQVEADSRDDVDMLEHLEVLRGPGVDVAPHQAVHVERSPTKAEHNHQHTYEYIQTHFMFLEILHLNLTWNV